MAFRRIGFVVASLILLWPAGLASAGSDRGRAGIMPAFYDDQLFTINFAELSQLTGDEDVLDAAASGLITLEPTTEVYRCSVVGSAP